MENAISRKVFYSTVRDLKALVRVGIQVWDSQPVYWKRNRYNIEDAIEYKGGFQFILLIKLVHFFSTVKMFLF